MTATYWRVRVTYESPNALELTFVVQADARTVARAEGLVLGNKLRIPIADVTTEQIHPAPEQEHEIPTRVVARSFWRPADREHEHAGESMR